jgi:hypothetical protein
MPNISQRVLTADNFWKINIPQEAICEIDQKNKNAALKNFLRAAFWKLTLQINSSKIFRFHQQN